MVNFDHTFERKILMKKILVTAALLATCALASAQTTMYGRVNATVDSTKTGAIRADSIVNDISHIGFSVKEDLGGGLSARAVIETSVATQDPTTGGNTQLGNRQSTVGLASKLGSVDVGRNVHGLFTTAGGGDAFGVLYGSIAGDVHDLRGLRLSNGVFVRINGPLGSTLGADRTHTATGAEATVYSATGKLGPVNAGVAQFEQGAEKSTVVSASTKLGNTGVFYSYSDNQGAVAARGNLVGVSQKVGAYTVKASYGDTNTAVKAYNVGAEYALSKRTDVLASYRNVDKTGTANDIKQVGVGVTHRF
jgi:predicted porin